MQLTAMGSSIRRAVRRPLLFIGIQCAGMLATALALALLDWPAEGGVMLALAVAQGIFAAMAAHLLGCERWWLVLHLMFMPAVAAASTAAVPPWLYGAGLVMCLALNIGALSDRVPYFPSGRRTWARVLRHVPRDRIVRVADIGCGFGGMCFAVSAARPLARVTGVEISPVLWIVCAVRRLLTRAAPVFVLSDYRRVDLAGFDVVFAYLSPAAMPDLWRKALDEMAPGSVLLSFEFCIPDVAHRSVVPAGRGRRPLYAYVIRERRA